MRRKKMGNLVEHTIGNALTKQSIRTPNKEAMGFLGQRFTYAQLNQRVNALANALIDRGIKKGDKVSILFNNGIQFVESYFAVVKSGGVVVALNTRNSAKEIHQNIDFSDSKMLIYSDAFLATVNEIRNTLPAVKKFLLLGGIKNNEDELSDEVIKSYSSEEPNIEVKETDEGEILFTGGTTGISKGVVRTHHQVLWAAMLASYDWRLTEDARTLVTSPLFHVASLDDILLGHICLGAYVSVMPAFDPVKCLENIRNEKLNTAFFDPLMFRDITNIPGAKDYLSSMRVWGSVTALMPADLHHKILTMFPDITLNEVFGQTENPWITIFSIRAASSNFFSVMYSHNNSGEKAASCGKAATHTLVKIFDDDEKEMPTGEIGEIVALGPATMKKYYKNEKETKKTLKGGWLHTGYIGKLDSDGYLYIIGRKKKYDHQRR
jgi:acyl-CoA synthetase (AMP-forming)/AMP-acid ligase II